MKPPIRITFWCCCLSWLLAFPVSGNAAWFTNQTGVDGGSPCAEYSSYTRGSTFSTMTAGQAYPIASGQSCGSSTCTGSSDTSDWNYLVSGNVTVKNAAIYSETVTVTGYTGPDCAAAGTWPNLTFSGCYTSTLYSGYVLHNETKTIPFNMANWLISYNSYDHFYVVVELAGSGSCIETDFNSWEHD